MFWYFGKFKKRLPRGFTTIELMVVMAIFAIITAIVLYNTPDFKNKNNLEIVTAEVATYIRGAQIYSVARKVSSTNSDATSYSIFIPDGESSVFYLKNNVINVNSGLSGINYIDSSSPVFNRDGIESYDLDNYEIKALNCGNLSATKINLIIFDRYNLEDKVRFGTNLSPIFVFNSSNEIVTTPICANVVVSKKDAGPSDPKSCIYVWDNGQITLDNNCSLYPPAS